MTPFRDFGSDSLPQDQWRVGKQLSTCNWVQSMEGNLDTAHISYLHQYFAIEDSRTMGRTGLATRRT